MSATPPAALPYPLFGSDFRLGEGSLRSRHLADALGHSPLEIRAKIMGGNPFRLVPA